MLLCPCIILGGYYWTWQTQQNSYSGLLKYYNMQRITMKKYIFWDTSLPQSSWNIGVGTSIKLSTGQWIFIIILRMALPESRAAYFIDIFKIFTKGIFSWCTQKLFIGNQVIFWKFSTSKGSEIQSNTIDWLHQVWAYLVTHSFKPALLKCKTASRVYS